MYVSHKHKYLFIHIPKTGGTAVIRMLPGVERIGKKHDRLIDLKEPERYRDYFIFTVVRNPYRRYASEYRWRKLNYEQRPTVTLNRLIEEGRLHDADDVFSSFSRYLWWALRMNGIRVQSEFVMHPFLKPRVFRYEETDLSRILPGMREIERDREVHYWGRYDWQEWMDDEGVSMINELCAADFPRFGYEKHRD